MHRARLFLLWFKMMERMMKPNVDLSKQISQVFNCIAYEGPKCSPGTDGIATPEGNAAFYSELATSVRNALLELDGEQSAVLLVQVLKSVEHAAWLRNQSNEKGSTVLQEHQEYLLFDAEVVINLLMSM